MMFRDQVGILASWFKGWNECEQTVALLSLLKRVTRTQARFLQLCLEHSLADCNDIHLLESEANSAAIVSQWQQESKEKVVSLLLSHLPLLQPGNTEAKSEYMRLLQKVLAYSIESNAFIEESRQLLSYALIHPATTLEDRNALALWLSHLEERLASGFRTRPEPSYHSRQGSDEWGGPTELTPGEAGPGWQDKPPRENGHVPFHPSSSVPPAINSIGSNANTGLPCQIHPSPLKRSMSLIPTSPQAPGEWPSPEELGARAAFTTPDHAPLSPQSSVASSGSEQTEEQGSSRNTFQEDGSGMKDVPSWLKSLRLHKYAALFSQMSYEEMMTLTEQHLESQNVTKGARHKIALSIQKLRERQSVLKSLEKDVLEGGNLRNALQELQQIIITPIKAYSVLQATPTAKDGGRGEPLLPGAEPPLTHLGTDKGTEAKDPPAAENYPSPPAPAPTDSSEPAPAPVADGDIPSQFTRVMGKVCTQLLVSRPDEENITSYLQLIEKCLTHEAFTETQKKRLLSWKQQVLKLLRTFPRKAALDMQNYRQQKGWAFGSNSLPIAGSVGMGVARRTQRQFPMPPRALPPGRMGLLSPSGIGGVSPRHALTSPSLGGQGRQNLWFANPGGSNSMPSQSRSSVQRTHSLPVHSSPQAILMFPPDCPVPGPDLEINPTLESLCLSMTEHALGARASSSLLSSSPLPLLSLASSLSPSSRSLSLPERSSSLPSFSLLLPFSCSSSARKQGQTLMKVAAQNLIQNTNIDNGQKSSDGPIQRFDKCLEEFYALCDQLELCLRLAHECLSQSCDSAKHSPTLVPTATKPDAVQPDSLPYPQYLAVIKAQITCAKDIHTALLDCANKVTGKTTAASAGPGGSL